VHGITTEARAHLQTPVEGLAAENLGIDGALEFRETVKALWSWPFRQPIEIAIGPSHVAVRARRNIDDYFSPWHDTPHVSLKQRVKVDFGIDAIDLSYYSVADGKG
jgi:hypothetical protein